MSHISAPQLHETVHKSASQYILIGVSLLVTIFVKFKISKYQMHGIIDSLVKTHCIMCTFIRSVG